MSSNIKPVSYTHLDVYKRQHLDGQYAAFGKVLEGAEVAIDISRVPRDMRTDQPKTPVVIESVQVDTQGVSYPAPQTH